MKYRLRNFENNFQIINSLGWVFVILSVILIFVKQSPGFLIFGLLGGMLIWIQLRGKRIVVDTIAKTVKSSNKTHNIQNPIEVYVTEAKVSQTVNSRSQSSNVRTFFYKAYLLNAEDRILLSSNRNEQRDLAKLDAIAKELGVELVKNY